MENSEKKLFTLTSRELELMRISFEIALNTINQKQSKDTFILHRDIYAFKRDVERELKKDALFQDFLKESNGFFTS